MTDEPRIGKALSFEGLELPAGDRLFAQLGPIPAGSLLLRLSELTYSRGIELDVRPEVLERWLSGETQMPESRLTLAAVWEEALSDSPKRIGLSLSHTGGVSVAASRTSNGPFAGVGIDVESAVRQVPVRVLNRISNPGDRATCPPIALWSLKEAIFKAALNLGPSFRDICVDLPNGLALCPGGDFRIALAQEQDAYVALAIAMRLSPT